MITSVIITTLVVAIAWTGSPELGYAFWSWLGELLERLDGEGEDESLATAHPRLPANLPTIPSSTVEAVTNLPFWAEIPLAVAALRQGNMAYELDLIPFQDVMELPGAAIVFAHSLNAAVGAKNLSLLYADTRVNEEGHLALYIWRKTWAERGRISLQRWVEGAGGLEGKEGEEAA